MPHIPQGLSLPTDTMPTTRIVGWEFTEYSPSKLLWRLRRKAHSKVTPDLEGTTRAGGTTDKHAMAMKLHKENVLLTFCGTFLQKCSQHSRDPQGWRSWTATGLLELGTIAWRPAGVEEARVTEGYSPNPRCFNCEVRSSCQSHNVTVTQAVNQQGSSLVRQDTMLAPPPLSSYCRHRILLGGQNYKVFQKTKTEISIK